MSEQINSKRETAKYVCTYIFSNLLSCCCYRDLLMAAVVVLPVLGVTWIIGILAVNDDENDVLVWIFAVFNALQVM